MAMLPSQAGHYYLFVAVTYAGGRVTCTVQVGLAVTLLGWPLFTNQVGRGGGGGVHC
jgi:hypothetical protein